VSSVLPNNNLALSSTYGIKIFLLQDKGLKPCMLLSNPT
jgi:hypothetical protein